MDGMDFDLDALRQSKLIGYGAGLATLLTLRETPLDLEFIVDDSPASQGTKLFGIPIVSPAELDRVHLADYRVVIFAYTGSAIRAIGDRLAASGLSFPDGWIDCSLLHFESYRRRLKTSLGIDASPELFAIARLLSLYTYPQNLSGFAGTWLYLELLKHLNRIDLAGDIAELGVFQGGNAFCSLLAGGEILGRRTLRLFDSFAGFPDLSVHDPSQRRSEFVDTTLTKVRSYLAPFANVRIHPGILRGYAGGRAGRALRIRLLRRRPVRACDGTAASSSTTSSHPGGMMLFHDYCAEEPELPRGAKVRFSGVKKAVDEFFSTRGDTLVHFPETTHVLAIRE